MLLRYDTLLVRTFSCCLPAFLALLPFRRPQLRSQMHAAFNLCAFEHLDSPTYSDTNQTESMQIRDSMLVVMRNASIPQDVLLGLVLPIFRHWYAQLGYNALLRAVNMYSDLPVSYPLDWTLFLRWNKVEHQLGMWMVHEHANECLLCVSFDWNVRKPCIPSHRTTSAFLGTHPSRGSSAAHGVIYSLLALQPTIYNVSAVLHALDLVRLCSTRRHRRWTCAHAIGHGLFWNRYLQNRSLLHWIKADVSVDRVRPDALLLCSNVRFDEFSRFDCAGGWYHAYFQFVHRSTIATCGTMAFSRVCFASAFLLDTQSLPRGQDTADWCMELNRLQSRQDCVYGLAYSVYANYSQPSLKSCTRLPPAYQQNCVAGVTDSLSAILSIGKISETDTYGLCHGTTTAALQNTCIVRLQSDGWLRGLAAPPHAALRENPGDTHSRAAASLSAARFAATSLAATTIARERDWEGR